jgi:pyrimidine deaminase RibD-like protein
VFDHRRHGETMTPADEVLRSFMREALLEGRRALPACRPNPPVGCVLVRGGAIVARGFTQVPYQPHAEPMALRQIEGDLQDVTAFVTLEPCAFHQRTPSCAKELIVRRVGAVYVALIDPHPRNQGRGIDMLREAGVRVVTDFLADEAQPDLVPYLYGAEGSRSTRRLVSRSLR